MPHPIEDFTAVMAARLEALGYSQRDLAKMIGSTQGHVSGIVRGNHQPNIRMAKRWADALGLRIVIYNPNSEDEPS